MLKMKSCFVEHLGKGNLSFGKIRRTCTVNTSFRFQDQVMPVKSTGKHLFRNPMLFGTKRGVNGNPPGSIQIFDEQETLPNLDINRIRQTISDIRQVIGYETYDVSLVLCEDEEMQELNKDTRGVDAPTDILSFPFQEEIIEPGILAEPSFDIPDYYNLGDMIIDIPYIIRRCKEDFAENSDTSDFNCDIVERGVSGAMSTVYDPEARIHMLLVHGMLHLVGYDHIEDDDYNLMVSQEELILEQIKQLQEKKN